MNIILLIAVVAVIAIAMGWINHVRGVRRFNERYDKMTEEERRAFDQSHTSTRIG